MGLLFVPDWHRCTYAVWLTSTQGGSVSNFRTPPIRDVTSKNNKTSEENSLHAVKSSPPFKTHTRTPRQLTKATLPETPKLLSTLSFPSALERGSVEQKTCTRKQQEEASNLSRGAPNDPRQWGKKDSLRKPDRKDSERTEMSQNSVETWGKSSRDLKRALDDASCQMKW